MDLTTPAQFVEALKNLQAKGIMPTNLDSAQLRTLAAAVRRQSIFSAETMQTGYLGDIKDAVESIANPKQVLRPGETQTVTEGLNPATARARLQSLLRDTYGYTPAEGIAGTIKDLSSSGRIDLVVKTNVELVQGAGKFIQGNANPDVVDLYPAWELVRYEERDKPRDWEQRWRIAAQTAGDAKALACLEQTGRMCALKSSGIWQAIGYGAGGYEDTLGNPFPPFAFRSGMWCDDVSRDEATEMGLMEEGDEAEPAELDLASLFSTAN